MTILSPVALLLTLAMGDASFISRRYGLEVNLPAEWTIAQRERDDRIFVAVVPGPDLARAAVVACELAIAPESLEAYRTRIDASARRAPPETTLTRNEIVATPHGKQLETLRTHARPDEPVRLEYAIRRISYRQMYTFLIHAESEAFDRIRPAFETLVASARFTPPETGIERVDSPGNRWLQREFQFSIDLPQGWQPALAPAELALFYACGPPRDIWSDNCLVIARPRGDRDLRDLERSLPDMLGAEEPQCEILKCEIVKQGNIDALETIVRTRRGPFSMTVVERRFRGQRFDYELKFTLESQRFDALLPAINQSFESFEEDPGDVPGLGKPS